MANNQQQDTYQDEYTLVEQNTEYEWKTKYTFIGAVVIPSYYRRKFVTKTYEATLTEALPSEPTKYNHDANIPTETDAKTVVGDSDISGSEWKLQAIEYTKSLSTPLSRDCRITFIRQYAWEHIDESSSI